MGNNSKLPVQTRYSAYVADGMILLQSKFNGVLTEMEEADRAIENAGIEGISPIEIAYTRAQTAGVEDNILMNILDKISDVFEIATSETQSNDAEINELIQYSKIDIPDEFLDIIKEKKEIEILVNKEKYVRLWSAKGCKEMNDAYHIQQYIPESLAIGDDECSNALLYAKGNKGFGVYIVSFGDLGVDEMVFIADSLEAFFVNGEGIDIFNNIW